MFEGDWLRKGAASSHVLFSAYAHTFIYAYYHFYCGIMSPMSCMNPLSAFAVPIAARDTFAALFPSVE